MQEQLQKTGNKALCPIAIIARGGKMLMGYRHYTPNKWKKISVWTVPGGRCEDGEKIEETLRREVREETGITDLQISEYLGEVPGAKEGDTVPIFACVTKQEPILMEPEKFSEWKWIDFSVYKSGKLGIFNPKAREVIVSYISRL
jgi:ADP-ribose pyrophosphatase YjhB (NUDIX family)